MFAYDLLYLGRLDEGIQVVPELPHILIYPAAVRKSSGYRKLRISC